MEVGGKEFARTKYDSLEGKTVVAHVLDVSSGVPNFQLVSSRSGVKFDGKFEIESEEALQEFAQLLSAAWTEHRKLKPRLTTTLSGH